jgi:alpha-tubulin suppressor-like RCC1 family protein
MQALNPYGPGRLTEYDTGNAIYSGLALYAWGSNSNGEVGDGTVVSKSSPVQVGSLTTWDKISAGSLNNSAAILSTGELYAWGTGNSGVLGTGNTSNVSSPVQIGALTNWSQLSIGQLHTAAAKSDGTIWAWGYNPDGRLGDNSIVSKSSPVQIGALTTWSQISAGQNFTAAIRSNGTLWAWGQNSFGQLGQNNSYLFRRSSPVQVGALTTWSGVGAGQIHVLAIKTDGTIWGWGDNVFGQLGQNSNWATPKSSPVQIGALTNWSKIAAGGNNSAAITSSGAIWLWGRNTWGQVGDNTVVNRSSPVQVGALTTWDQVSVNGIAAGTDHGFSMALKIDRTLWTWGLNSSGQIGDNTTVNRSSPVQVGSATSWFAIAAGRANALALYGVV